MEYDKDDIKRLGVTLYQLSCGMDYYKIGSEAIRLVELLQYKNKNRKPVREDLRLPIKMNGNYVEISGPSGYVTLCHIVDVDSPNNLSLVIKAIILAFEIGAKK